MEMTTIIREDDMSEQDRIDYAMTIVNGAGSVVGIKQLEQDAAMGRLRKPPRDITTEYPGETQAEALASGYAIRDTIEKHTDFDVTCELTGTKIELPTADMYEMRLSFEA